jgi:hypothetical protein
MSDKEKEKELLDAAGEGLVVLVERLINEGVDINTRSGVLQYTALHAAALGGHLDVVKELLKSKAKLKVFDEYRDTPLDYAKEGRKNIEREYFSPSSGWRYDAHLRRAIRVRRNAGKPYDMELGEIKMNKMEEMIHMLTFLIFNPVKQRLAFVHGMNDYGLDLDVLKKICEMHLSLHE